MSSGPQMLSLSPCLLTFNSDTERFARYCETNNPLMWGSLRDNGFHYCLWGIYLRLKYYLCECTLSFEYAERSFGYTDIIIVSELLAERWEQRQPHLEYNLTRTVHARRHVWWLKVRCAFVLLSNLNFIWVVILQSLTMKLSFIALQQAVMKCRQHLSLFKTVAICSLVNVHLVFVRSFYEPYCFSCSACQIRSLSAVIKAGFIQVGCRSAEELSCISGVEISLPQMLTSGLLMFLSPQVHSLMWRDWFSSGCFSSQRSVRFQSPIKEVLATGIHRRTRASLNFKEDEKRLIRTALRIKTAACIYYSLLSCRGSGCPMFCMS